MARTSDVKTEPFAIGAISVDPGQLYLSSASGQSQLEPKVMHLLQVLAAEAGHTVTRETLIDSVWGVQFGGDESLTRAVSLLRKALQVPHGLGDVIKTIPRRGYVLDAEISAASSIASNGRDKNEPLLAVLPFDNLSSDADTQFFSDGICEDIIDRLIRGTDLKVIGRTSSFQFRGDRKFEAASELGAAFIVDGSVRRADTRVRISAHLERADTHETLWSDRYDRELEDIFAVQDEISEQIAMALDRKLEGQRQSVMTPATYDLFLQGRDWTQSPERIMDAVSALEEVTKAAPDFAPAWGALARNRALARMFAPIQMRVELGGAVDEAIERALEMDPGNRDALNARYQKLDHFGNMTEHHDAIADFRDASRNTAGGLFLVAFHETCIGRMRKALDVAFECARLDPLNPYSATQPGIIQNYMGDWEPACAALEAAVHRWPESAAFRATLAVIYGFLKNETRMNEIIQETTRHSIEMQEYAPYLERASLFLSDDKDKHKAYADRLRNSILANGAGDTNDLLHVGFFGGADLFYDTLEKIRMGPTGTHDDAKGPMAYRSTLLFHVIFAPLRADERFIKFCARLGLVKFWLETGIRPDFADEIDYDFEAACEANANTPIDKFNPFKPDD